MYFLDVVKVMIQRRGHCAPVHGLVRVCSKPRGTLELVLLLEHLLRLERLLHERAASRLKNQWICRVGFLITAA